MGRPLRITQLACCVALTACAAPGTGPRLAPGAETRVYDSEAGRFISHDALTHALADADVVFVGEQHDDPATHRAEAAILARAGYERSNVVVSLEMFERDVQPVVDAYMRGAIQDSAFLAASRPWPNYIKDYRPLVELARANGWSVVASNIPRRLASAVGRSGLRMLDTLSASERGYVARDLSCPRDRYHTLFKAEMSGHSAGGAAAMSAADSAAAAAITDRFYEAQCAKDETMAEAIVDALDRSPRGTLVMHFNGAFHSNERLGTVERVLRRRPRAKVVVITAVPVEDAAAADAKPHARLGDFILLTPRPPKPPSR
jgi:uncharacterized iron-regulated protein